MSMLGTRAVRERRVLFAVAKDPLAFHRKAPTPLEVHTLLCLRNRGLVEFWDPRSFGKNEWYLEGSEPWRAKLTEAGWASLSAREHALLRLGA